MKKPACKAEGRREKAENRATSPSPFWFSVGRSSGGRSWARPGGGRRARRHRISKTEQRSQRRKRSARGPGPPGRALRGLMVERHLRCLRWLRSSVFEIRYLRTLLRFLYRARAAPPPVLFRYNVIRGRTDRRFDRYRHPMWLPASAGPCIRPVWLPASAGRMCEASELARQPPEATQSDFSQRSRQYDAGDDHRRKAGSRHFDHPVPGAGIAR